MSCQSLSISKTCVSLDQNLWSRKICFCFVVTSYACYVTSQVAMTRTCRQVPWAKANPWQEPQITQWLLNKDADLYIIFCCHCGLFSPQQPHLWDGCFGGKSSSSRHPGIPLSWRHRKIDQSQYSPVVVPFLMYGCQKRGFWPKRSPKIAKFSALRSLTVVDIVLQ